MSGIIPNFFKLDEEIQTAKDYLVRSITAHNQVRPILTYYQQDMPIFTITFPVTSTPEERVACFAKIAWTNCGIKANGVRFVVDSAIQLKNDLDEEYNQDLALIFFCNKVGCFVNPRPYIVVQDGNVVEWVDKEIDDKFIMDSQTEIIDMLAAQFFFPKDLMTWTEFVEYIEHSGFEIEYHYGFDKSVVEFAQAALY